MPFSLTMCVCVCLYCMEHLRKLSPGSLQYLECRCALHEVITDHKTVTWFHLPTEFFLKEFLLFFYIEADFHCLPFASVSCTLIGIGHQVPQWSFWVGVWLTETSTTAVWQNRFSDMMAKYTTTGTYNQQNNNNNINNKQSQKLDMMKHAIGCMALLTKSADLGRRWSCIILFCLFLMAFLWWTEEGMHSRVQQLKIWKNWVLKYFLLLLLLNPDWCSITAVMTGELEEGWTVGGILMSIEEHFHKSKSRILWIM